MWVSCLHRVKRTCDILSIIKLAKASILFLKLFNIKSNWINVQVVFYQCIKLMKYHFQLDISRNLDIQLHPWNLLMFSKHYLTKQESIS